jgi:hypothetical protein
MQRSNKTTTQEGKDTSNGLSEFTRDLFSLQKEVSIYPFLTPTELKEKDREFIRFVANGFNKIDGYCSEPEFGERNALIKINPDITPKQFGIILTNILEKENSFLSAYQYYFDGEYYFSLNNKVSLIPRPDSPI